MKANKAILIFLTIQPSQLMNEPYMKPVSKNSRQGRKILCFIFLLFCSGVVLGQADTLLEKKDSSKFDKFNSDIFKHLNG